jgi:nucleoside-diphosphate kinase
MPKAAGRRLRNRSSVRPTDRGPLVLPAAPLDAYPFNQQRSATGVYMAVERTLSIVKPDAVARNLIGAIYTRFEQAGLRIVAARMLKLSQEQAEGFYAVHKERPFFKDLVKFMTSGPVMVQVLEGEDAIARNREIMGATDPRKAAPGTIRADYATDVEKNAVHGSDGPETAQTEIRFFFQDSEIYSRA